MPEMPRLGAQPHRRNPLVTAIVFATVVGAIAGGLFWFAKQRNASDVSASLNQVPTTEATTSAAVAPTPGMPPGPDGKPTAGEASAGANAQNTAAPLAAATAVPPKGGAQAFTATISGPLESAVVTAVGKETGIPLTQVINRSLVWWVRIPQDLVRGDTISVVFETRDGQEPLVHAVRFVSRKMGKTFEAFRYKAAEDAFARFYQADGRELEERLVHGPIDSYEQITSLLRDGRRHKGVDFKAPVGTPVKAPFSGTVVRKNWNFRANGNSLELAEAGGTGRSAMFLHLSEITKSLQPGHRIERGQVIARTGNTGRSFAPHLHYQLMKSDRPIDPFESHETQQASLPPSDRLGFEQAVARLKALMPAEAIAGG